MTSSITYIMFRKIRCFCEIAEKDACKIEHVISKESFEAIKEYVKANIR